MVHIARLPRALRAVLAHVLVHSLGFAGWASRAARKRCLRAYLVPLPFSGSCLRRVAHMVPYDSYIFLYAFPNLLFLTASAVWTSYFAAVVL